MSRTAKTLRQITSKLRKIGAQFRAHLKPLGTIYCHDVREVFRGRGNLVYDAERRQLYKCKGWWAKMKRVDRAGKKAWPDESVAGTMTRWQIRFWTCMKHYFVSILFCIHFYKREYYYTYVFVSVSEYKKGWPDETVAGTMTDTLINPFLNLFRVYMFRVYFCNRDYYYLYIFSYLSFLFSYIFLDKKSKTRWKCGRNLIRRGIYFWILLLSWANFDCN